MALVSDQIESEGAGLTLRSGAQPEFILRCGALASGNTAMITTPGMPSPVKRLSHQYSCGTGEVTSESTTIRAQMGRMVSIDSYASQYASQNLARRAESSLFSQFPILISPLSQNTLALVRHELAILAIARGDPEAALSLARESLATAESFEKAEKVISERLVQTPTRTQLEPNSGQPDPSLRRNPERVSRLLTRSGRPKSVGRT